MRRLFSTVSYLCWLAIPGTAAAQSCAKLPTCAELGYEATGCPEEVTPMVCPFDNTKVYCPEDCREYKLTWCDETKGTCVRCGNGNNWKYESCKPGWYLSGYDCVENECPGYHSTSETICGCETVSSCQKGDSSTVYKCVACADGYELTDDGLCESKYKNGEIYYYNDTPIGVVFVKCDWRGVVALKDIDNSGQETNNSCVYWNAAEYNFGSKFYDIDTLRNYGSAATAITDMDGKSNTRKLLEYVAANGKPAEAATATSLYAPSVCPEGSFCGKGQWYLPAMGELRTIADNLSEINSAIAKAGGISLSQHYFSSTEESSASAWKLNFLSNNNFHFYKYSCANIRPVLSLNSGELNQDKNGEQP